MFTVHRFSPPLFTTVATTVSAIVLFKIRLLQAKIEPDRSVLEVAETQSYVPGNCVRA